MVAQKKRNNLEGYFWDSMVVKEKRSILGSFWFEIHDSKVTSTLSQNWDHLHWVSWGKLPMVLKFRKLEIQCFKRIAIRSWKEGDIVDWSRAAKEHGSTVMLSLTQNRGYIYWDFWGKPHIVLNLKKSGIQCFKRISIQSWNEGDIADGRKAEQRAWQHGDGAFN